NHEAASLQRRANFGEPNRAQCIGKAEKTEHKTSVADAVNNKSFFPCVRRRLAQKVEADEKVAAQTDAFPADEEQSQVIAENHRQHGEHETIQVTEEAVIAPFMRHVTSGINVNEEADAGDHAEHDGRKRIQQHAPLSVKIDQPP